MAKYVGFNRNEVTISGGALDSREILSFVADDDMTIVGIQAEVAISLEPNEPTIGAETAQLAGFARILVNRAGNALPANVGNSVWDFQSGVPITDTLNDADSGDTWAIAPIAVSSAGSSSNGTHGSNDRVQLAPGTKRRVRRGDSVQVQLNLSNSGLNDAIMAYSVTGTLFTHE